MIAFQTMREEPSIDINLTIDKLISLVFYLNIMLCAAFQFSIFSCVKKYVEEPVLLKNIFGETADLKRKEEKPHDEVYWKMIFLLGHYELQELYIWVRFKIFLSLVLYSFNKNTYFLYS